MWRTGTSTSRWQIAREEVDKRIGAEKFRGTWTSSNLPNGGTHGDRLIDATWSNGKFQDTMLLPDDDSSDHPPLRRRDRVGVIVAGRWGCSSDHPDVGPCTLAHGHDGPHSAVVQNTHAPAVRGLATWDARRPRVDRGGVT